MPAWKKVIVSGSDASLNSINVATNVVAQSFTGSLFGTSSWSNNAITASYVNPLRQDVIVTGSLLVSSSLMQYSDNTDVDNGVETVMSVATGSYRSAFFDYVIASGSNARSGTVMAVWNGASVQYTEASTNDIGSTVNINLDVTLSGANVLLRARANSDNWSVKTLARLI